MVEKYLIGLVGQSLERTRQLRRIVQRQYPPEYDGLRRLCLKHLENNQAELQSLAQETVVDTTLQTPLRVRRFKRLVEHLNGVEGIGVFALSRISPDDSFLNRFITKICSEIAFPLRSPTASHISQDYFQIYPGFELLCVPLLESRFLLHLPDLYHELCHLFHHGPHIDLPELETYHAAYVRSQFEMVRHFRDQTIAAERLRKPAGLRDQPELWMTSWSKYWMQEFFCDLFAVSTAGPAYAWSHYHLCVERGGDPFETPLVSVTTHPADDARMRAALLMLTALGFDAEAKQIEETWRDYLRIMDYSPAPEYQQCYPEILLSGTVSAAQEGIKGSGVVVAEPDTLVPGVSLLNDAWQEFWQAPEDYQAWETEQLKALRTTLDAAR
ncbi:MAG: hypothetical protein OXI80_14385 [Caldilineaceae bacterium]|nr:hypothetical protein [Caldilineaceae bacterium]MDE0338854.1 hypothetical protein [Caldilineaceae bacterium]